MIKNKQDYIFFLEEDRKALGVGGIKSFIFDDIWKFQRLMRKIEYIENCKSSLISKLLLSFWKAIQYNPLDYKNLIYLMASFNKYIMKIILFK